MKIGGKGAILVLSGPSGSGKSSLVKAVIKNIKNSCFSISTTTREPRKGEKDGREYHFVSKEVFLKDINQGDFIEWEEVHGNYYGTDKKQIEQNLNLGRLIILDVDVKGFLNIKKAFPDITTSVFVTTENRSELKKRLMKRDTDSSENIDLRIANSVREIESMNLFDFVILNDDLERSKVRLEAVAMISRMKTKNVDLNLFMQEWERE